MATNFRREIGDAPSFLRLTFHHGWQDGKADGCVSSAEVLSTSYTNLVNFGRLTLEFTVMIWRPSVHQMREIVEMHSILETDIRQWMAGTAEGICAKFTQKTCLVLQSDEFECQGQRSGSRRTKNCGCHALTTPPLCGWNGTPSLQITSRKQQTRRFDRCGGVSSPGCMHWVWRSTAGLCHTFVVKIYTTLTLSFSLIQLAMNSCDLSINVYAASILLLVLLLLLQHTVQACKTTGTCQ